MQFDVISGSYSLFYWMVGGGTWQLTLSNVKLYYLKTTQIVFDIVNKNIINTWISPWIIPGTYLKSGNAYIGKEGHTK